MQIHRKVLPVVSNVSDCKRRMPINSVSRVEHAVELEGATIEMSWLEFDRQL